MLEAPSGGSLGVKGIQCAVPRPMHGLVPSGASRGADVNFSDTTARV